MSERIPRSFAYGYKQAYLSPQHENTPLIPTFPEFQGMLSVGFRYAIAELNMGKQLLAGLRFLRTWLTHIAGK